MRRCFWKLPVAIALFGWLCGVTAVVHAADDTNIDMDEITRRVTEWRSSFVNMRVVWELRSLPETNEEVVDWPPPPGADAGSLFDRIEWIWADHGLDLLEERTFFNEDGGSKVHTREVFNGPKGLVFRAQMRNPPQGPEESIELELLDLGTGKPTSAKNRTPVGGLYWPGFAAWLPEMLSKWKWNFEAIEDVAGEPCARIVAVHPDPSGAELTDILWLDWKHDCIVRRYRTPAVTGRRIGSDFIVDEIQELDVGIWFPKRGRIQLGGTGPNGPAPKTNQIFVVTEAAVNQSLDLARFEAPTPQVGTPVNDHGRQYRYGVSRATGRKRCK